MAHGAALDAVISELDIWVLTAIQLVRPMIFYTARSVLLSAGITLSPAEFAVHDGIVPGADLPRLFVVAPTIEVASARAAINTKSLRDYRRPCPAPT